MPRHALLLAVLLAASLAPPAALAAEPAPARATAQKAARPAAQKAVHPDTGGDADCAGCHEQATPAQFKAWFEGRHGMNLVRCQICHGSTGADFTRRPPPERCRGCHGAEVDSFARLGVPGKDCFLCHAPHTLAANPHR